MTLISPATWFMQILHFIYLYQLYYLWKYQNTFNCEMLGYCRTPMQNIYKKIKMLELIYEYFVGFTRSYIVLDETNCKSIFDHAERTWNQNHTRFNFSLGLSLYYSHHVMYVLRCKNSQQNLYWGQGCHRLQAHLLHFLNQEGWVADSSLIFILSI